MLTQWLSLLVLYSTALPENHHVRMIIVKAVFLINNKDRSRAFNITAGYHMDGMKQAYFHTEAFNGSRLTGSK